MQLLLILVLGLLGAAASGRGLVRSGRNARWGAIAGIGALALILGLALSLPPGGSSAGLFDGSLLPTGYMRLVVGLWGLDALVLVAAAWLLGGLRGLRTLLPAMLLAITGGTIVFGSASLAVAAAAATVTALVVLVAVPPSGGTAAVAASMRELRVTLVGGALLLAVVAMAPVAAALSLGPHNAAGASGIALGAGSIAGLAALAVAAAIGARLGAIPSHVRIVRLADLAAPIAMPLIVAWVAVPLGVVSLAVVDGLVAPLALPLDGERGLIVLAAVVTLVAAALAAYLQDDLRHAAGYLVIADGGLVLLGLAALDPAAWGPARAWLVVLAASKTALGAWAAVTEDRFATRSIPDLRGWLRRSPILGTGFALTVLATFGIPGWVAFDSRSALASLAGGEALGGVLLVAGFLTLPTYLRILWIGAGPVASIVDRAAPERVRWSRNVRTEALRLEADRTDPGAAAVADTLSAAAADAADARGAQALATGDSGEPGDVAPPIPARVRSAARAAALGRSAVSLAKRTVAALRRTRANVTAWAAKTVHDADRLANRFRRDRTELLAVAVVSLAVLALLTSWGALDIAAVAAEPAPHVSTGPSSD